MKKIKLGLLREGKVPPDSRVILTPKQCAELLLYYPNLEIKVQSSPIRCYTDENYKVYGIFPVDDVSDCDILAGVKEVPVAQLLENKTYLMFSHTHKGQAHNKSLLQAAIAKKIRLIDYELMTNEHGVRLIAFGYFAGLVGAHNALMTWGLRTGALHLDRVYSHLHFEDLKKIYRKLEVPAIKIAVTGAGRVASGVVHVLDLMGIKRVEAEEYIATEKPTEAIYVQLDSDKLYEHNDHRLFVNQHFYDHPTEYHSIFQPYYKATDLMINAIYWDKQAPKFFDPKEMRDPDFRIKVIADITCDMNGSIPSTIRATSIANPVMGYDPVTEKETKPFQPNCVDVMAIDNLPNELPRDASAAFGEMLIHSGVMEELTGLQPTNVTERATICKDGKLVELFGYLKAFVEGK